MTSNETKIELVTEAIEALVLATVVSATGADKDRVLNHQNILDARQSVGVALKALVTPTLRVVEQVSKAA